MTITPQHLTDRRTLLCGTVKIAGAAIVLPSIISLSGCSVPPSLKDQMALISAVSDRIIPVTDTPGAIAAGAPEYIAAVFDQHLTEAQQDEFLAGLEVIADTGFLDADPKRQDEILSALASGDEGERGQAIFQQLHDMVVFAFYTSEAATQELAYEELPGRYDGCVSFAEIGKAWLERGV